MNQPQPAFRVGLGYDIHPLVAGRPCILGGVAIPSPVGPDGHSDADVVLHAVADAILGAAGLRDIGHYFPNTDAAIKGLDSAVIVKKAVAEAKAQGGWHGRQRRYRDHRGAPEGHGARRRDEGQGRGNHRNHPSQVGIKATTNEGMDSIGQGKALAVQAICLVFKGN